MERLTEEEVQDLLDRISAGDKEAENRLIGQFTPLVKAVAGRYFCTFNERADLEQAGYMGLLKAFSRYDPHRGVKFTTFAVNWIKGEILSYLRKTGELQRRKGGAGSARTGEGDSGIDQFPSDFRSGLDAREELIAALDFPLAAFSGVDLEAVCSGDSVDEEAVQRVWLKQALQQLEWEERRVIFLRYFQEKTQQETGRILGISQRKVSRLEKKVLDKMKTSLNFSESCFP